MPDTADEIERQRQYYAETAVQYEAMHVGEKDEHSFALSFLAGVLDYLEVKSVLDVGSGTGRAIQYLKRRCPKVRVVGIEPVKELRDIGHSQGLSKEELIDGDATRLPFETGDFDLVCEFAVLHHLRKPKLAVAEMLRVAKKAIFISDSNNFGQGSATSRLLKQVLNGLGLWKAADLIATKGKGYKMSEGDGLAYSYSVFNNYKQIKAQCRSIHLLNTKDGEIDPYKTAGHVALLGIKKD